ncbi:MAG TPA: UvrD-helicase domain-containing protein, partial [Limnochordia bacterium]|nr:UvrD-helicase domain-containing protein [Limnochordia bacterium]
MKRDWLAQLNGAQRRAVEHGDGPLLIIAGAGSGKTRVLTYRIAYLLRERDVKPWQVLAVTFTNKAAAEMRERIEGLIGPFGGGLWVGTFHATCVQILRRHADRLGYKSNFVILDRADQTAAMKRVLKTLNLDPRNFDPRAILAAIGSAKNELVDPVEYEKRSSDFRERHIARCYRQYQSDLKANNAFDFDDLLVETVRLFDEHPDVLAEYQERFRYILVDEYQDTNRAQYVIVSRLAGGHRNLLVVGDADQSIYAFRGADIRNILEFEHDYPDAKVIKLEQNYRSTAHILRAANELIENNRERPAKALWTENPEGELIKLARLPDERREAEYVADEIERLAGSEGLGLNQVALLYRTHAQSRTFEECFMRRATPYRIVSGLRFYERKEIKDAIAYLRLIANPFDAISLERIINVPKRGIGEGTLAQLERYAAQTGLGLLDACGDAAAIAPLGPAYTKRVLEFHRL